MFLVPSEFPVKAVSLLSKPSDAPLTLPPMHKSCICNIWFFSHSCSVSIMGIEVNLHASWFCRFYEGVVDSFDPIKKKHKVRYLLRFCHIILSYELTWVLFCIPDFLGPFLLRVISVCCVNVSYIFIYVGCIYWWWWRNIKSQTANVGDHCRWSWCRWGEWHPDFHITRFSSFLADTFCWQGEAADNRSPDTSSEMYVFIVFVALSFKFVMFCVSYHPSYSLMTWST